MMMVDIILLAWRYLWHRRVATIVSILAIALSLAVVVGTGLVNFAVKKTAVEGSLRYPLVIGPSGTSGAQLILSAIFHVDKPSGTLPYSVFEKLSADSRVAAAFPMAVSDSYMTVPIVGVSSDFLADLAPEMPAAQRDLSDIHSAILGSAAAQRTRLKIGDSFHGQHGMVGAQDAHVHADHPYRVVGILPPTGGPEDAAIYTRIESVWMIHAHGHHHGELPEVAEHEGHDGYHGHDDHDVNAEEMHGEHEEEDGHLAHDTHAEEDSHGGHDEIDESRRRLTAILVRTRNPVATGLLEREYSETPGTVAVDTARSIRALMQYLNRGEQVVELLSAGMLVIALAMILVTLVMSLNERRTELALLRSLGVRRLTLSVAVMLEVLTLTLCGAVLGVALGHGLIGVFSGKLQSMAGLSVEPFVVTHMEITGLWVTLVASQVIALIAMVLSYRLNVVEEIARG